jgi:hypothetical protein
MSNLSNYQWLRRSAIISVSQNSNLNCINAGDYSWFCFEIGCVLSRALEGGERRALADFFIGQRNSQQNQHSCRFTPAESTSEAVGN